MFFGTRIFPNNPQVRSAIDEMVIGGIPYRVPVTVVDDAQLPRSVPAVNGTVRESVHRI